MIYVGPDGELSDRDLTDHEGPPSLHHYKPSPLSKKTSPWEDCETTRSLKRKLEAIENLDLDEEEEEEGDGKKTPTPEQKVEEEGKETQQNENIVSEIQESEDIANVEQGNENIEDEGQQNKDAIAESEQRDLETNSLPNELAKTIQEEHASTFAIEEQQEKQTEVTKETTSSFQDVVEPQVVGHTHDIDNLDDDYFEELQELDFLDETLDKNLASDEEFEFQEKDFLPNFTEHPTFHPDDLRFSPKGRQLTEKELKETAKYALSKTESLLKVESDNIAALEDWNDSSVDVAAIMRYHKPARVIKPSSVELSKASKKSHTSKSSSSDASSSDAESIILPEKPCFSFMTCDAINDESDNRKSIKRHSGSFIVSSAAGDVTCRYDVTAQLVEACQPEGYFEQGQYFVFEKDQHSPDEFYYDDTELIWSEKEDDLGTVTVLYSDERGQGIEKTITAAISDDSLFPDLDQKLDSVNQIDLDDNQQSELSIKLHDGSSDSVDSDQDLPPRSPAMDTPMKLFYHLVPSPHSSSNEDLDESKMKAVSAKALSPIQEYPSRESSLNRSSESLMNELRDQNYNIVDAQNGDITVDTMERDVKSPPPKFFRTVEHDQMNGTESDLKPDKHELQSIIQRFVAEQLMESQGITGEIKISRPQPRPASERGTPTRGNRRCRVISPNDSANQDILLPPLKPHRRSMLDRARVIRSPNLGVQRERECSSDVVSYRRDYNDDSSDSSLTTRTEPWSSPIRPRPVLPTPATQRPTNVTFLGCEASSPVSNTKVVPVDTDSPEDTSDDAAQDKKSSSHERYQEFGYQSEPEVRKNRNRTKERKAKRDERGYVSEGENKVKAKEDNSDSFVKLTYDGSEVSGSEAEIRHPRLHRSEPHVGRYGNLKRPAISREKIDPKTPYAPQSDYKTRHHQHRSSHKVIYRVSGEFSAVVTTAQGSPSTRYSRTSVNNSMSCIQSSPNRRLGSTSTVNSCTGTALGGSTSTVWVLSEPAMSSEEMTADERSVPGTPVSIPRGRRLSRLRFFR